MLESRTRNGRMSSTRDLKLGQALLIGAVQGLSLPFRGFSRSGATISAGMLAGAAKTRAESFSFALAVVLTPAVVVRKAVRLMNESEKPAAPKISKLLILRFSISNTSSISSVQHYTNTTRNGTVCACRTRRLRSAHPS